MNEKKYTVRPEIEVNLSQQDIDDIMAVALDGGICYWCRSTGVSRDVMCRSRTTQSTPVT